MSDMTEAPRIDKPHMTPVPTEQNLDLLAGLSLRLSVEVGSTSLTLAELLALGEGSIVVLDRGVDDRLDIFANGTMLAKGEVVAVDGRYGIRVVELVTPERAYPLMDRRA